jgi:hypothetical protein
MTHRAANNSGNPSCAARICSGNEVVAAATMPPVGP